jgi:preprotein translocase subunit SecE
MAKAVKSKQQKPAKRADAKRGDAKKTTVKKADSTGAGARRDEDKRAKGRSERTQARVAAKPSKTVAKPSRAAGKPSERKGISKFVHDVRIEMKKVTWPTRKDLTQSTIVVIVAVVIAGALIAGYDFVFSRLIEFVIPK